MDICFVNIVIDPNCIIYFTNLLCITILLVKYQLLKYFFQISYQDVTGYFLIAFLSLLYVIVESLRYI